ncbi:MAG: hypothetical protein QNJ72_37995 [Pleurocapsa sp. MO_226.B13]|nr:hypothetical protein [Pleurocapsa sp. MO_226.B13]
MPSQPDLNNRTISSIPNVSLVAFYGDKPPQFITLIERLQAYLANHQLIQDKFIPYQLEQVHGTIIGCEGVKTESGIIGKWFFERRQEQRYLDCAGSIAYLQRQVDFPLTIRFGGYDRNTNYRFLSRSQHLYFRSFQLQPAAEETIPVLIGWSWENNRVSLAMDDLRRNLQQFNLLHKYHALPDAIDNDFYLRLGTINASLTPQTTRIIASEMRNLLESQFPSYISIDQDSIAFVQYQDLSLTPATTKVKSIAEITPEILEQLYPNC